MPTTAALAICLALTFASPDEFDKGLAQARALMSRGKWAEARDAITALAKEHAAAPIASPRRAEVREMLERAAFRASYAVPDPKALTSGKILSYNAGSKRLKIAYDGRSLGDFERYTQKDSKTGEENAVLRHPVRFTGPYTIDVKTSVTDWAKTEFSILFNIEGERYFVAALFPPHPSEASSIDPPQSLVARVDANGQENFGGAVFVAPTPQHPTRLVVGRKKLEISTAGKKPITKEIPITPAGGFGFIADGDVITEVVVEGPIDPTWFQGLADAAETKAFDEFRKTFDPLPLLPPSFAAPEKGSGEVLLPDLLTPEASDALDPVLRLAAAGRHDDAIAALDAIAKDSLPPATRDFIGATSEAGREKWDEALERVRRVVDLSPVYLPARRLEAHVLDALDREDESAAEYERLLADFPTAPDGYVGVAIRHVREERIGEAERILARAEAQSIRSAELEEVSELLRKAKNGPKWDKPFVQETPHYRVVTDLNQAVAAEAARILMQAHREYSHQLERKDAAGAAPSRVFLFASQAGYKAYAEGIQSHMENSAGLYNPALRQLLIWNQPDEKLLKRTIRHEGFHQYFHRVARHRPVWLDEGLAEYFELGGDDPSGVWKEGQIHHAHVAILKQNTRKILPLEEFFVIPRKAFYAAPETSYAQAWAVAHFLRQDAAIGKPFFRALLSKLVQGATTEEALNAAFATTSLSELKSAFAKHVAYLPSR